MSEDVPAKDVPEGMVAMLIEEYTRMGDEREAMIADLQTGTTKGVEAAIVAAYRKLAEELAKL